MAEEAASAPAEGQDTPSNESAPEASEQGTRADELNPEHLRQQGDVDWEKRYNDLYPEFTRRSQRLSELEGQPEEGGIESLSDLDPETRQTLLQELAELEGFELEEDDEDEEGFEEEDDEFRDPRVDELIAEREQEQVQALAQEVTGHVEHMIEEEGLDLTDRQKQAILREVWNDGDPDPDTTEKIVRDWKADLEKLSDNVLAKYKNSKQAASPPQPGSSGTPDIPITDDRARLARAVEVANQQYGGS